MVSDYASRTGPWMVVAGLNSLTSFPVVDQTCPSRRSGWWRSKTLVGMKGRRLWTIKNEANTCCGVWTMSFASLSFMDSESEVNGLLRVRVRLKGKYLNPSAAAKYKILDRLLRVLIYLLVVAPFFGCWFFLAENTQVQVQVQVERNWPGPERCGVLTGNRLWHLVRIIFLN